MRMSGRLSFLALVFAVSALGSEVFRLENETFHAHLEAHPLALVAFCVPWYEPCQKLYPELEIAAEFLKPKAITVASVNCTAEVNLCSSLNVTSYPALRVFRGPENVMRFREKRKAKSIVSYMLKLILPKVSVVTKHNIEELRSIDMPLAIAFIDETDQDSTELFTLIAEENQDQFVFGITSDTKLAKSESTNLPFLVLYSSLDHTHRLFGGPFDRSNIEQFLSGASEPLIGKFSMETYYAYTQSELSLLHIFAMTEQERQSLAEALQGIAEQYRGEMNFATIDAAKYGFFAEALGLPPGLFPALVIEDVMSGDTVPFDQKEEITSGAVGNFLEGYFNARKATADTSKDDNHDEL